MIVRDLYIMCVAALPTKACAPLVIDADAPLPFPIAGQFFQSVAGRDTQIIDCLGCVDRLELAPSRVLHLRGQRFDSMAIEYRRGELVGKRADHRRIVMYGMSNVKRYYHGE